MAHSHRAGVLFFALAIVLGGCGPQRRTVRFAPPPRPLSAMAEPAADAPTGRLEVHFVDVGQGDCTLLVCPAGERVLVDGGSTTRGFDPAPVAAYLRSHLDAAEPRVDALVITHADADHYNLLPELLSGVDVGHIYYSGSMGDHDNHSVDEWLAAFEPARRTRLWGGQTNVTPAKRLGEFGGVDIRILASNVSDTSVGSEVNTRSIVLKVSYGDVDVLLTGDATRDTEDDILRRHAADYLDVEVLKLGHHGSDHTSTSEHWLAAVRPEVAVASAGMNNTYGHPHRDVVGRTAPYTSPADPHRFRWSWREKGKARFLDFSAYDEAIYSTATNGNVVVSTDGNSFDLTYDP